MTMSHISLASEFKIPNFVIGNESIYLLGYSYHKLSECSFFIKIVSDGISSSEEKEALVSLKQAIRKGNIIKLKLILDEHPTLPRLLTNPEDHNILMGYLLDLGRIRDLERIYGVVISEDILSKDQYDGDEMPEYETFSRKDLFGSRTFLLHERIVARRSKNTDLLSLWSPDSVAQMRRRYNYPRWPTKSITTQGNIIGKGSFGLVFKVDEQMMKFNFTTSEYIRELISQLTLNITSQDLSNSVTPATYCTQEIVHKHLLFLKTLKPLSRTLLLEICNAIEDEYKPSYADKLAMIIKKLLYGIRDLRDRFIMHLDISHSNVLWDENIKELRLIDFGGTIGDDSFLDLGQILTKVCTRTTRAPEYSHQETLFLRNDNSEALSTYYAIMSYLHPDSYIEKAPQAKEDDVSIEVMRENEFWDLSWRSGRKIEIPKEIQSLRRVHACRKTHLHQRASLNWILDGAQNSVEACIRNFECLWPRVEIFDSTKRKAFIDILLIKIKCSDIDGTTCGGLLQRKMVPPPYTAMRCLMLYDALAFTNLDLEFGLRNMISNVSQYCLLVNSILYVSLSCCKTMLVDVEHYENHPLHFILRSLVKFPHLTSILFSPLTAFSLIGSNNYGRMIGCIFSLVPERRILKNDKIINFIRTKYSDFFNQPQNWLCDDDLFHPPKIASNVSVYIESIINLWFKDF